MRVLYDAFVWTFQQYGGINRYFEELFTRSPSDVECVVAAPAFTNLGDVVGCNTTLLRYSPFRYRPGRFWRALEPWYYGGLLRQKKPDVFHPTYYETFLQSLPRRGRFELQCPVVTTVYDFIIRRFPDHIPDASRFMQAQSAAIRTSDVIICISESTKADLLEFEPSAADRSVVIPLAGKLSPSEASVKHPAEADSRPFFLFVGGRTGYKGFDDLLRSIQIIGQRFRSLGEVVVVGPRPSEMERKRIAELQLDRFIRFVGPVNDCALVQLYQHCIALVYPSRFEGFGIPILEAMQCGAPVIACDTSSIPEVAGEAAMLVPPGDPEALVFAMEQVASDADLRNRLIASGYVRARSFTWQRTANETFAVYRQLLS